MGALISPSSQYLSLACLAGFLVWIIFGFVFFLSAVLAKIGTAVDELEIE